MQLDPAVSPVAAALVLVLPRTVRVEPHEWDEASLLVIAKDLRKKIYYPAGQLSLRQAKMKREIQAAMIARYYEEVSAEGWRRRRVETSEKT